jgi:hypothetical protein
LRLEANTIRDSSGDQMGVTSSVRSLVKRADNPRARSKIWRSRPSGGSSTLTATREPLGEISTSP